MILFFSFVARPVDARFGMFSSGFKEGSQFTSPLPLNVLVGDPGEGGVFDVDVAGD